jgi:hypothetical protein
VPIAELIAFIQSLCNDRRSMFSISKPQLVYSAIALVFVAIVVFGWIKAVRCW